MPVSGLYVRHWLAVYTSASLWQYQPGILLMLTHMLFSIAEKALVVQQQMEAIVAALCHHHKYHTLSGLTMLSAATGAVASGSCDPYVASQGMLPWPDHSTHSYTACATEQQHTRYFACLRMCIAGMLTCMIKGSHCIQRGVISAQDA